MRPACRSILLAAALSFGCQAAEVRESPPVDTAALKTAVRQVAEEGVMVWERQEDIGAQLDSWSTALGTPWAQWNTRDEAAASYTDQWARYDYRRAGEATWQVNVHSPNVASAVTRIRYVRTDTAGAEATVDMVYKQVFVLEEGAWKLLLANGIFRPVAMASNEQ